MPAEEEARAAARMPAFSLFDVTDPFGHPAACAIPSERARLAHSAATSGARFGAHQFCERMTGTLVYAVWFGGGLRIIDVADPQAPREVGYFIPSL